MGVDTTMFACFEGRLTKAQVKSFGPWHDHQFAGCGFYSTATAHRHDEAELTLLRIEFESADADLDAAFTSFVQSLARKSRKRVTVVFDHDGDYDASELNELLERADDHGLFSDRLEPEGDWVELELATGEPSQAEEGAGPAEDFAPPPADPTRQRWHTPSERDLEAYLGHLRNADPVIERVEIESDLVFTRGPEGRLSRLLICRSSSRRELKPLLQVLRGFVREVTVESSDDIAEARDALDLSVRVQGVKNPFFDD